MTPLTRRHRANSRGCAAVDDNGGAFGQGLWTRRLFCALSRRCALSSTCDRNSPYRRGRAGFGPAPCVRGGSVWPGPGRSDWSNVLRVQFPPRLLDDQRPTGLRRGGASGCLSIRQQGRALNFLLPDGPQMAVKRFTAKRVAPAGRPAYALPILPVRTLDIENLPPP